jgi:hypothetical protein
MKNTFKFFLPVIIIMMFLVPVLSHAEDKGLVTCGKGTVVGGKVSDECGFKDFIIMINNIITFILEDFALPICAIMFAYAGISLVTSGGSSEGKTKAKSVFTNAVIGLALVAGAWLIVKTVLTLVGYTQGGWIGF